MERRTFIAGGLALATPAFAQDAPTPTAARIKMITTAGPDLKKIEASGGKFLVAASCRKALPCLVGHQYTLEPAKDPVVDLAMVTSGSIEPRDLADFVRDHRAVWAPR